MARSDLGDYLTGARARITPSAVNLPTDGLRRVPGLRREEVAALSGVSVDYYVRLEQGRERHPSAQVLAALAAALRLGDDAREHLFRLAGMSSGARSPGPADRVHPSLAQLMDAWPDNPALVYNRAYDVIASNALADALFCDWPGERNLLGVVFGSAGSLYSDWDDVARNCVAGFRVAHGQAPDDPRVREVLARYLCDERFARLWREHDARGKTLERKHFDHPEAGLLTLTGQTFEVRAAPGQDLVIYHAEPGSADAQALRLLGTLAATKALHLKG
ncbi:helix-turn-helix transcriptional regulator [Kineosporia sp. NBRC 101731]|uniref:helix-turn-helix domain-containing protein n=1 Tax=Kineosporia sp. NBRC 101731 TaxID=3032199 RepID=UPI0024A3E525|nr:helix-turn-helix transcriptional regulator [Kineosporia sp. NBRC 101731]GLY30399.1 transcriptional regulator [Kineosporia sp. NBRC 101731]